MPGNSPPQSGEALLGRQIETFYQVNRFISTIDNLDELLGLIMRESEAAVGAEASCIALYEPADGNLHIDFASGAADSEVRRITMPLGKGILGEVAVSRQTLLVGSVQDDPRFDRSVDRSTGFKTKSVLATPIQRRDELLGVLEVINKRDGPGFSEDDARLLEIVANQAAIAIENSRLFERLVRSEQLSTIGKMAASIIHDFKKPLSVIRGFTEFLAQPDLDDDRRRSMSNFILEDVDRFLEMTQELLEYTRGEIQVNPRKVQLGEWVNSVCDFLWEDFGASKVELLTALDYQGTVKIDPDRMRRVVINIASNAVDAMPEGGAVTIASSRMDGGWKLYIRDTGKGIPDDIRRRIFEPFATFGKDSGTGLGLAIAKEIVEGHGGSILVEDRVEDRVENRPHGEEGETRAGTEFMIAMPDEPPRSKPA